MEMKLKPYKKSFEYSYAFGAFAVFELLAVRPEVALAVYFHSGYDDGGKLAELCGTLGIPAAVNDRLFDRVGQKENSLVFAVFAKYACELDANGRHVCLVNPGDMGNLGCIARSMAGFGYGDLAIIRPAADAFDPKTVRASMGALFRLNIKLFDSFRDYQEAYIGHILYPFMTDGAIKLGIDTIPCYNKPYALVFGNEAAGLPAFFAGLGNGVAIPQTGMVDSLNLSVAVGIGLYQFNKLGF